MCQEENEVQGLEKVEDDELYNGVPYQELSQPW